MPLSKRAAEKIVAEADLLGLILETVPVVRCGRLLRGPCPFRETDGEPFEVHVEEGFFYCRDCGRDGNAIDWVMTTEYVTRDEAARILTTRLERTRVRGAA